VKIRPETGGHRGGRRAQPRRWLLVAIGIPVLALVAFALMREIGEGPTNRLRSDLPGHGPILITLHLAPDPPTVGTVGVRVQVDEIAGAAIRGATVAVAAGSNTGPHEPVVLMPAGAGGHQGVVTFPDAGRWWLDVEVARAGGIARVRFPVEVQRGL
jgi:hypothetical protein